MFNEEDDEDDINPLAMLLSDHRANDGKRSTVQNQGALEPQLQRHYIASVDSTVVIRQLPSQGLSFQLWPAATTLVTLLDEHRRHPGTSPLSPTLSALSDGPNRRPLKVLELGSGTGLVGIVAAATLGAKDGDGDGPPEEVERESAFFKKAKKVFEVEVLHVDRPCDGSRVGVIVYRFAGKQGRKLNVVSGSAKGV
ncbi:hypothetical protein FNV43_RR17616 [Rhamnella rubrinervis]|uniref:Methyltransferase n=1 Tax=Rhamnella rubrinervis TaxID=2594499 RepID=A0A8K0E4J5_9ROSA|nr:hypothetical protein FNV43_RR17616 [Rhamnella rubrinervis]